jgi:hypothetical protein
MESHSKVRNSQTHLFKVLASQSPACVLGITILPATKSGGHKVKVGGGGVGGTR